MAGRGANPQLDSAPFLMSLVTPEIIERCPGGIRILFGLLSFLKFFEWCRKAMLLRIERPGLPGRPQVWLLLFRCRRIIAQRQWSLFACCSFNIWDRLRWSACRKIRILRSKTIQRPCLLVTAVLNKRITGVVGKSYFEKSLGRRFESCPGWAG